MQTILNSNFIMTTKQTPEEVAAEKAAAEKAAAEKEATAKANRERFEEAATRRVQKALLAIESLQQFTSDNYAYTKEDVEVINQAIMKELEKSINILLNPKVKKQLNLFGK